MINVQTTRQTIYPGRLDNTIKTALPSAIGISTGWYGVVAHLPDGASQSDEQLALSVLKAHDTLNVVTDKATIQADGSDTATITCDDPALAGDADFAYTVWLDGEVYDNGTDTPSGGVATLTLATNIAGIYEIEIRRNTGDYASGVTTVEAQ